jgi:hypothetical protein
VIASHSVFVEAKKIIYTFNHFMIKKVKKLHKDFREKLYLTQYIKIQYWIDWQAKKHELLVKKLFCLFFNKFPECKKMKYHIVCINAIAVMKMIVILLQ